MLAARKRQGNLLLPSIPDGYFMDVVMAERHLYLSPSGFVWLIGAIGDGALVGPLIPNILATDFRNAR